MGEIGGDNGEVSAFLYFLFQKFPDQSPFMIVMDAACYGCYCVLGQRILRRKGWVSRTLAPG